MKQLTLKFPEVKSRSKVRYNFTSNHLTKHILIGHAVKLINNLYCKQRLFVLALWELDTLYIGDIGLGSSLQGFAFLQLLDKVTSPKVIIQRVDSTFTIQKDSQIGY